MAQLKMKVKIKYYIQEDVNAIRFNVIEIIVNVIKLEQAVAICVDATIVLIRLLY